MTKLTNAMRDEVLETLKAETIGPRREELDKELSAACQKIADAWHPPAVRKWLADMPREAKSLIVTVGTVVPCSDEPSRRELLDPFIADKSRWARISVSLPRPVFSRDGRGYAQDVSLGALFDDFQAKLDRLFADWEQLRTTASAALRSCNTVKQLQEKFPDLAAKLPAPAPQTKALTITPERVAEALRCAREGGCNG